MNAGNGLGGTNLSVEMQFVERECSALGRDAGIHTNRPRRSRGCAHVRRACEETGEREDLRDITHPRRNRKSIWSSIVDGVLTVPSIYCYKRYGIQQRHIYLETGNAITQPWESERVHTALPSPTGT